MNAFMYKQIGRKVAYYRQLRELTQEQLASRIHISTSSISRIERGKYNNNIPLSMLMVIAEGLKIDLAMLVTFNEQEKKIRWDGL
ncbi:helix-turn-helix domain-containing protein [Propionispira raffinosivorans]|uniref:helix-turn-helix domain-containing protein n=1 Tax=Propionispira raffinosivorans TaxID=86959 RepID=UPI000365BE51|nr:helix-turn-helix transcriptional regulator [Propionispira raffinosivorans]